jgi:uncharacterized membrane protein YhaH (DUF805 family)
MNLYAPFCPQCGAPQAITRTASPGDGIPRTFGHSVEICLRNYANFNGRAPRAEFWFFQLFVLIVNIGYGFLYGFIGAMLKVDVTPVLPATALPLFVPNLAVVIRRLHDLNRSGWFAVPLAIVGLAYYASKIIAPNATQHPPFQAITRHRSGRLGRYRLIHPDARLGPPPRHQSR